MREYKKVCSEKLASIYLRIYLQMKKEKSRNNTQSVGWHLYRFGTTSAS